MILVAINTNKKETRNGLLNAIVSTLPPEIYGLYINETSIVKLLIQLKTEFEAMTIVRKLIQIVILFEIKNNFLHIKQFREVLTQMEVKLAILKVKKVFLINNTILFTIKYLCSKQYKYILLNYENYIITYNLTQTAANKKTLNLYKLMNKLLIVFEEY